MYATFFVPQDNAPRLREKLEKLSRKAVKLGCAAILCTLAKTFSALHPDRDRAARGEVVVYEALTIQGEPPRLNGWVFAATLEHHAGKDGRPMTLLKSHSEETLPHKYRTATPDNCDHCRTTRRRNNTFVVRHEETGEWKQVGRQCLKDFLGLHKDPGALARYASALLELETDIRGECEGGYGSGGDLAFDLDKFLGYTVQAIDDNGWMSRTQARESIDNTMSTADHVWFFMSATNEKTRNALRIPAPTDKTYEEVKEALAWVMEQDASDNDYFYNLQVITELDYVTYKTAGYAASIVSSHRRAKERNLRRAVLTADGAEHFGTPGKREEFKLTFLGMHTFEGHYGMTYLHRFMDADGNAAVWFASNDETVPAGVGHEHPCDHTGKDTAYKMPMVAGCTYRVKATVKQHGEYNGKPQTQVTRVAVQPLTKPKKTRKRRARKSA